MNPHHFTWADALLHGKEALQKQEQLADVFSSFSPSAMSCVYIPCCHQEVGKSVCFVVFTCLAPPACLVAQAGNSPAVPQLYDVRKGGYRRSCVTACSFFSFLICQRRAVGTVGFYCLFFFLLSFLRSNTGKGLSHVGGAEASWHPTESSLTCLRTTGVVFLFLSRSMADR